ncbi:dihydrolipoyl dehydrogenase [Hyalangium rubrum]|uniref:Dihydrolipoyl dehydrogenase n=1 Tax=Hyalangium rubrum TaxID=3103134 RepID=A0ABU5H412_9BACT|nr:dihydrolipoyl dehydrogenase [Hyalangium sp. s54d21]MDY7228198.1 dihydrolipoyl dehydrogenase [Hyalangium sp. s54d21]
MAESFDVVIIGSGPGGYVGAIRAAQLGLKTAIIEKDKRLGGTCLHRGCIPTKSLLWTAELFHHIREASDFGIDVASPTINWANAQKHKEKVVTKGANGIDFLMKKNKITVVKGHGRISGKGKVEVTAEDGSKQTLETKNIIIATGSVPKSLPNVQVDHKRVLNSDSILMIDRIPKSIIVLGAGAVGCEFASVFNHVGSQTSIVEYMPNLLPIEDIDASKELERYFKKRKIDVFTGTKVEKVEHTASGVKVTMAVGNETKTLEAELLLSAVGRAPVTEDIGLKQTSIQTDRGYIKVDSMMRTSEPNVYAIGDVIPTAMLAHVASAECVLAVEHIAGKNPQPINYDLVPSATYCYPEVASVGLTEKKAKERGYDVKAAIFPFSAVTKASISNEGHGMIKVVSDKKYDEVLGVHLVGPHATELLAEACVALRLEITTEELAHTMHAHPTLSEIMKEGAEATLGHPIHI